MLDGFSLAGVEELDLSITALGSPGAGDDTVMTDASNQAPVATDDLVMGFSGEELTIPVLANDSDPDGDALDPIIEITDGPTHGKWIRNADGSIRYTPLTPFIGTDQFRYQVKDVHGAVSNEATVTIGYAQQLDVGLTRLAGLDLTAGDHWYHLTTEHAGLLTAQANFDSAEGDVRLYLYPESTNPLDPGNPLDLQQWRMDYAVEASQQYYLRVTGTNEEAELVLANLVQQNLNAYTIYGTSGDDQVDVSPTTLTLTGRDAGGQFSVDYPLAQAPYAVTFLSGEGIDRAVIRGTTGDDVFDVTRNGATGDVTVARPGFTAILENVYSTRIVGAGGANDVIKLHGSTVEDGQPSVHETFVNAENPTLRGDGFETIAEGFSAIEVGVDGDGDVAHLYGSSGDDRLTASPGETVLARDDSTVKLVGFRQIDVTAAANGGHDEASLLGSDADDTLEADADDNRMTLTSGDWQIVVSGFEEAVAEAGSGGTDQATILDSSGNDTFKVAKGSGVLRGPGVYFSVANFATVHAHATAGGYDDAWLFDSPEDETFTASPTSARLAGDGFVLEASGFELVKGIHLSQADDADTAVLEGSAGSDALIVRLGHTSWLQGDGFDLRLAFFNRITVRGGQGDDKAELLGTAGDDVFVADPAGGLCTLTANGIVAHVKGFAQVAADGKEGLDQVDFIDTAGDDTLTLKPGEATFSGDVEGRTFSVAVTRFETTPHDTDGNGLHQLEFDLGAVASDSDTVHFYDTEGNDTFKASMLWAKMAGPELYYHVAGFQDVHAHATAGQDDAWLFDYKPAADPADDTFTASAASARLASGDRSLVASGFDLVKGISTAGDDTATLDGTDGADTLVAALGSRTAFSGQGFELRLTGFAETLVRAGKGDDHVTLVDSAKDDTLVARGTTVEFAQDEARLKAEGVEHLVAYGHAYAGNRDTARLLDTAGNDTLEFEPGKAAFTGPGMDYQVHYFQKVEVYAGSGDRDNARDEDVARLSGSPLTDSLTGSSALATFTAHSHLVDAGYVLELANFNELEVEGNGGDDWAILYDTAGDDTFTARPEESKLEGPDYRMTVKAFDYVHAVAKAGGNDKAELYGSAGDETFVAKPQRSLLNGGTFLYSVRYFDEVVAHAEGGNDFADLYDHRYNDSLVAEDHRARLSGHLDQFTRYSYEVDSFASVRARASRGYDTVKFQGDRAAIDAWLDLWGTWNDITY